MAQNSAEDTKDTLGADFKIETTTRQVFVGGGGVEFETHAEAVTSFVQPRLEELLCEGGGASYDFDVTAATSLLVKCRKDVIRWLSLIGE